MQRRRENVRRLLAAELKYKFGQIAFDDLDAIGTIYAHHAEEDMNLALVQPWCSIGSDGLAHAIEGPLRRGSPHPRSFGTFPRVLGVYARERRLFTVEEAVPTAVGRLTILNRTKAKSQPRAPRSALAR